MRQLAFTLSLLVCGTVHAHAPKGGAGADSPSTDIACINVYENGDSLPMDNNNVWHMIYDDTWVQGTLVGPTYEASLTATIASFAEGTPADGKVTVTTTAGHGLSSDARAISISNTTNYNGIIMTEAGASGSIFEITHSWDGDDGGGTVNKSANIIVTRAGYYHIFWTASLAPAAPQSTYDVVVFKNASALTPTESRFEAVSAGKYMTLPGGCIPLLAVGDILSLAVKPIDHAGDLTFRYIHMDAKRQ